MSGVGRLRMAVLGTAAVAVALVTFVALGVLPRITGPVGTSSGAAQASAAASATLAPAPTAMPPQSVAVPWPAVAPSEASVPSSLDGQAFAFWALDERAPCCGSTLRISTSIENSEDVIDIPPRALPPEFWALPAGPADGRVVYVVDDGRTAHLMVEDAWTGAGHELTSTSDLIAQLAIDPSGSTAYYLLFDRPTSAFQGLWAVPTVGGRPRPLIAGQATTATAILVAERVYFPQFAVSTDGSWIVFANCQPAGCEFQALHPDGTAEPRDWSNFRLGDTIVGIAGDLLIGSSECPQPICDGFVLDLLTGERWPLGGADRPFVPQQLIAGPRGPLVLGESADHDEGLWHVEAVDLTNGRRSSVFGATFQPGVTMVRLAGGGYPAGAAAELPPGWFLIYRNTDAAALLPPDYSAATAGAAVDTKLPFMKSPHP